MDAKKFFMAVVICLLPVGFAHAQTSGQKIQLPFDIIVPQRSEYLQQYYIPRTDTSIQSFHGDAYDTIGPNVQFEYVVTGNEIARVITNQYQDILQHNDFEYVSTNLNTQLPVCPEYISRTARPDVDAGVCDLKYNGSNIVNFVRRQPDGDTIVTINVVTIGQNAKKYCKFKGDKEHALMSERPLMPGDNLLWICASWPLNSQYLTSHQILDTSSHQLLDASSLMSASQSRAGK